MANFTPERGVYTPLKPFRYWCQKVLPLVYDDSLSYYELLGKVVDFLNKAMEDVETLNDDVTGMYTAYGQLEQFVNEATTYMENYLADLDIQPYVNEKLDAMASSGMLTRMIEPLIRTITIDEHNLQNYVEEWLNENLTDPTEPPIDSSLTVSGAGADSAVVGSMFAEVDNAASSVFKTVFDLPREFTWWQGYVNNTESSAGNITTTGGNGTKRVTSGFFYSPFIRIACDATYDFYLNVYTLAGEYLGVFTPMGIVHESEYYRQSVLWYSDVANVLPSHDDLYKFRITIRKTDNSDITPEDVILNCKVISDSVLNNVNANNISAPGVNLLCSNGAINGLNGNNKNYSTLLNERLRVDEFIYGWYSIDIASGYEYELFAYEMLSNTYIGRIDTEKLKLSNAEETTSTCYTTKRVYYNDIAKILNKDYFQIRLVVKNVTSGVVIYPSEINCLLIRFNAVESHAKSIQREYYNHELIAREHGLPFYPSFEQGYLNAPVGDVPYAPNNNNYYRRITLIPTVIFPCTITCLSDYSFALFAYSLDGVCYGCVTDSGVAQNNSYYYRKMITFEDIYNIFGNDYDKLMFRVTVKRDNNEELLADGAQSDILTVKYSNVENSEKDVNILLIGNSFTEDEFSYVPLLITKAIPSLKFTLAIAFNGGATLSGHWTTINTNGTYSAFRKFDSVLGKWSVAENVQAETILASERWDVICLQQASQYAGDYTTYQPYLNNLINKIQTIVQRPIKFMFNLNHGRIDSAIGTLTPDENFENMIESVKSVLNETAVSDIFYGGTAIQNARTVSALNSIGEVGGMCADNTSHLQNGLPCLIAGYANFLKFCQVVGELKCGVIGDTTVPSDTLLSEKLVIKRTGTLYPGTAAEKLAGQKCAVMANKFPLEITDCSEL